MHDNLAFSLFLILTLWFASKKSVNNKTERMIDYSQHKQYVDTLNKPLNIMIHKWPYVSGQETLSQTISTIPKAWLTNHGIITVDSHWWYYYISFEKVHAIIKLHSYSVYVYVHTIISNLNFSKLLCNSFMLFSSCSTFTLRIFTLDSNLDNSSWIERIIYVFVW